MARGKQCWRAVSKDGLKWERPVLDVVPGTNIVMPALDGRAIDGADVWLDHFEANPEERFRCMLISGRGPLAAKSSPRPMEFTGLCTLKRCSTPRAAKATTARFTTIRSAKVSGDKTRQLVTWKNAADLERLKGQTVRFKFLVKNAALYSFWVTPDKNGASFGYVAAGRPEFNGLADTGK